MKKIRILQFAVLPPPIGGVSVHVQRLIDRCSTDDTIYCDIYDYSRDKNPINFFWKLYCADLIHIHLSNKTLRKHLVRLLKFFGKKSITTFHGQYSFEDERDIYALLHSTKSIVLNLFSINNAKKVGITNVVLGGAFIPPSSTRIKPLRQQLLNQVTHFIGNYERTFCTNASSYVLDKFGKEIYMGTELLRFFRNHPQWGLIFSDSSATYKDYFNEKGIEIPNNVLMISEKHDFVNIIKYSDAFIRATTMDGDSLSVKESLYYKVPVFATNVVDRPAGTIVFENVEDLADVFKNINCYNSPINEINDNYDAIKDLYIRMFNAN